MVNKVFTEAENILRIHNLNRYLVLGTVQYAPDNCSMVHKCRKLVLFSSTHSSWEVPEKETYLITLHFPVVIVSNLHCIK